MIVAQVPVFVGHGRDDTPKTAAEAAHIIATMIETEAASLALAGYEVDPTSITVSRSDVGKGWLSINMKAMR